MTDTSKPGADTPRQQAETILRRPAILRSPAHDYPIAASVRDFWDALRGDRIAPARTEIDPRAIAPALEYTFIAELVTPEIARLRIAGRQFEALLGMDPRGMPLSVFFALGARAELAAALAQVARGARAQLPLRGESGLGKPALDGMLLALPLTDDAGQINRVLGVLETRGPIGRSPRRFKLSASRMMSNAPIAANPLPPPAVDTPRRERPACGRPRLRVIDGGRA
ncbi:MAG: hypothetical protein HLUCCA12_01655 [Rhodobacteraceae bacterium HLUCCA12]|nr:MAG: hypothetical protein HLUCCA12_01655 [Rhodobacteraceae bacterium HLUCCA12]